MRFLMVVALVLAAGCGGECQEYVQESQATKCEWVACSDGYQSEPVCRRLHTDYPAD